MAATTIEEEILEFVRRLPPEQQRRVRDFAQALAMTERPKQPLSGKEFVALMQELAEDWDPDARESLARALEEAHAEEKARYRPGRRMKQGVKRFD
jgi:hypothetical protein